VAEEYRWAITQAGGGHAATDQVPVRSNSVFDLVAVCVCVCVCGCVCVCVCRGDLSVLSSDLRMTFWYVTTVLECLCLKLCMKYPFFFKIYSSGELEG
jgi:hypothetical protein